MRRHDMRHGQGLDGQDMACQGGDHAREGWATAGLVLSLDGRGLGETAEPDERRCMVLVSSSCAMTALWAHMVFRGSHEGILCAGFPLKF